ncbi:MAG: ATP-binding protein [Opitutales bacterium]
MKTETSSFLNSCSKDTRKHIMGSADRRTFQSNEEIFPENTPYDGIYVIMEGEVEFRKQLADGKRQIVSRASAGEHFGELGIFSGEPRSLSATASEKTDLLHIPKATIDELIDANQLPLRCVLDGLVGHLHETTDHYVAELIKKQKMTLIGQMMSSLIHDFRNPLSCISLGVDLLGYKTTDSKSQEVCESMKGQINRIEDMAEDILAYVRGDTRLKTQLYHTVEFIDALPRNFPTYFESDKVEVVIGKVEALHFHGDHNRLMRVFQNLLSNAYEVLEKTEYGRIDISVEDDGKYVLFTIADNGPGIPPEIQNTLFEPFVTHGKRNGTGLGMAVVKAFVEAHKGTIDFKSSQLKGTEFHVRIPKKQG